MVLPGWVEAVYTLGMRTGLDYSDDVALASQFATPIFAGCYVSVSQLTHEQRTQVCSHRETFRFFTLWLLSDMIWVRSRR